MINEKNMELENYFERSRLRQSDHACYGTCAGAQMETSVPSLFEKKEFVKEHLTRQRPHLLAAVYLPEVSFCFAAFFLEKMGRGTK